MQTPANTERYMVTMRGARMAIRLHDVRVFDTEHDAVTHARSLKGWARVFKVSNDNRPKEIEWHK